jgi:hypothetical protein
MRSSEEPMLFLDVLAAVTAQNVEALFVVPTSGLIGDVRLPKRTTRTPATAGVDMLF